MITLSHSIWNILLEDISLILENNHYIILIKTHAEYFRIVNMNIKYKTLLEPVMDFESENCEHVYNICWPIGHYLPSAPSFYINIYREGKLLF